MYAHACRLTRLAPIAASAAAPLLLSVPQERSVLCSNEFSYSSAPSRPSHLIRRSEILCKCWSKGGFDDLYEIEDELGHGGFGTVYRARLKGTEFRRAVKKILKKDINVNLMENEMSSLVTLDHPHIVKLLRYFDETDCMYFVFELCTGPDLLDAMIELGSTKQGHMTEYDAAVALRHILKALKCCHGRYVGHYDIKPENFMYRSAKRLNLKMIDLGMSSGFALKSNRFKGTVNYTAPEIYRGVYGPEADVWSCGIVLFMMLTGEPFFPDQDAPDEEMRRLAYDRKWIQARVAWGAKKFGWSDSARDLLEKLLVQDRHMRITVMEALKHPFVQASFDDHLHTNEQISDAKAVLEGLLENFRKLSSHPLLKRATFLLIAHLVGYSLDDMNSQRLAFRMLDRPGNGELSVGALELGLRAYNLKIPNDMDDLFKLVDTDGDLYITLVDFLSATLPPSICHDKAHVEAVFRLLDRNGDGFIDAFDLIDMFEIQEGEGIWLCHEAIRELHSPPYNMSLQSTVHTYFLPKRLEGKTVVTAAGSDNSFRIDNRTLESKSSFLAYRSSKEVDQRVTQVPGPRWNSVVHGDDDGEWIKVQHVLYRLTFDDFLELIRRDSEE